MLNQLEIDDYISEQNKRQFQIGDAAKIIRKAESHEAGWDNTWVAAMDIFVGDVSKITHITEDGIETDGSMGFKVPHFVLEKVNEGR